MDDCTDFPGNIAEKALAHTVPRVQGAYNRGELLAKRRLLISAWSKFCAVMTDISEAERLALFHIDDSDADPLGGGSLDLPV